MWITPSLRIGTAALAAAFTLLTTGSADDDKASAYLKLTSISTPKPTRR